MRRALTQPCINLGVLDMLRQSPSSIATLAALVALVAVSESTVVPRQTAFAQSPAPLSSPSAVPEGTTVRIDGSNSMAAINQTLKQKFEAQFPDTKVEAADQGTEAALQALREDRVDLVALARPLTPAERAEGLVQTPLTRRKIAIVVGAQNPFPGDLTGEQFAQIFRGEITNWSAVGGPNKSIRVLDRPASDTRQALQSYPIFQSAPFQTGATGTSINDENIDAVIRQLGDDGISYAIVDQVVNQPDVRILSIYGTLPTEPNYAFSQSVTYVYKGPNPNPAVQAFLGYATAPEVQQTLAVGALAQVDSARPRGNIFDVFKPKSDSAPTDAGSSPAASPSPAPANPADPSAAQSPAPAESPGDQGTIAQAPALDAEGIRGGIPWWLWLLSIPVLGALIWALLRGSDRPVEAVSAPVATAGLAAAGAQENRRIVLVPRSSQEAYVYWEVPEADKQRIRKQEGGHQLALRLYDVTGQNTERQTLDSIGQFECSESDQDLHVPIPQSDRDYVAELGYVTYQGRWFPLAQSAAVHVPAEGEPLPSDLSDPVPSSAVSTAPVAPTTPVEPGTPSTFPRWEESFKTGGAPLVDPMTAGLQAAGATVEGAVAPPGATETSPNTGLDSIPSAAVAAGAVSAVAAGQAVQKNRVRRSQIVLVAHNSQDAYAYWEVLDHHKEIAKQHGGESFILRICDVTGVNLEREAPHSIQQFNCEETDRDRHVTVPDAGEYVAEIGYLANNGRWLRIARSAPVSIPPSEAQSVSED